MPTVVLCATPPSTLPTVVLCRSFLFIPYTDSHGVLGQHHTGAPNLNVSFSVCALTDTILGAPKLLVVGSTHNNPVFIRYNKSMMSFLQKGKFLHSRNLQNSLSKSTVLLVSLWRVWFGAKVGKGESEKTHFSLPMFVWNWKKEMEKSFFLFPFPFYTSFLHTHFLTCRVLELIL